MPCEPSSDLLVELVLRPRQRDQYIRVQQEDSHLDLILKQLFNFSGRNFRRICREYDRVEAVDYTSLNRRRQTSAHQFRSCPSKGHRSAFRVILQ